MTKRSEYILFTIIVLAVQIFLLNNLTFSTYIAPLAYIVCLILTPLGTSPLRMIFNGLLLGLAMDITMGTVGLNVIATLPVAYFRRPILHFAASYTDVDNEMGVPTARRIGRFNNYVVAMVILHSLLFFGFECMTTANIGFIALRFLCSTAAPLALTYLFIAIFTPKLTRR